MNAILGDSAVRCSSGHPVNEDGVCLCAQDGPACKIGYCYSCGILGAPRFYYNASQCRKLGHDVREVAR